MASSASFDGIVILPSPLSDKPSIQIQLGYPSPDFFSGEDFRVDPRVFQSLDTAGKIHLPADVPYGLEDNAYPVQYVEKVHSTPDLTQTDPALDLLEGGSMSCGSVSATNSFAWLAENGFKDVML